MTNSSGLRHAVIIIVIIGVVLLLFSSGGGWIANILIGGAVLCGIAVVILAIVMVCSAVNTSGKKAKESNTPSVTTHGGTSTSARKAQANSTSMRVGQVNDVPALKTARQTITEEKLLATRVNDIDVRTSATKVLDIANKVVDTLATKQKKIATSQQFLNYYLPTLGVILKKFHSLEENNMATEETKASVVKYLTDIEQAMNRQYENLFNDDILDLAVEMEAMTIACKRDGLLSDDDFSVEGGEQVIKLDLASE